MLGPKETLEPVMYEMHLDELFPGGAEEELRLRGGEYYRLTGPNQSFIPVNEIPEVKLRVVQRKSEKTQNPTIFAPDPFINAKGKTIIRRTRDHAAMK